MDIVFRDKPDKIFIAWIYQLAGEEGKYDLRSFCVKPLNDNNILVLIKAFGRLLRNDTVAL